MVIVYLTLLPRFAAEGSLLLIALFREIIDQFSSKIFLIFLILVSCNNKAMSAYCPWKKIHLFPLLFLSSLESFSVLFFRTKLGECVALWFAFTSPPLKLNDWRNKKTHSKFANAQRDTTNLAVIASLCHFLLTVSGFGVLRLIQWNPALRTPALYGQFRLSRQKAYIYISLKLTRFKRTPVNTDNGYFSVSRVTNSYILPTPLYGHWLSTNCLFSLSQLCDNCRHCTLFK